MPLAIGIGISPVLGGKAGISISVAGTYSIAEDAANGTVIGAISIGNTPADWGTTTFTVTYDPDGVFAISGGALDKNGTLDYETAQSHVVGITATPSGPYSPFEQRFTVAVTNVAPVLSNPTDTKTGQTTATITVDTTESNGTLYWVVTTSSTPPTAAQIIAGKDNSGVTAAASGTQAIATSGTKTVLVTGLTAATAYTAHFVHHEAGPGFLNSNVSSGNGFTTDAAGGAESAAFLARTSGLDATHTNAYTALIDGLVSDGVWTLLDALYVFATQDSTTAGLNLVSTSFPITVNGSPTFTADAGYKMATAATDYLGTAFNPTVGTPNYSQDSAHMSVWNLVNNSSDQSILGNGAAGTAGESNFFAKFTDTNLYSRLNDNSGSSGVAVADPRGHLLGNRSDSSNIQQYRNASSIATPSATSHAPTNAECTIFRVAPSVLSNVTHQLAAVSIGGSLSSTPVTNFYNRLRTYMTAVGVP